MKQFDLFKKLLIIAVLFAANNANAQVVHPKAFGIVGASTITNWYADYVGTRFEVTAPTSIAGDKRFTSVSTGWGVTYTSLPLVNKTVVMGPAGDTNGCTNFAVGSMAGKIAFIWRGTCEFGAKALNAQQAGAIAVVICNNQVGQGPINMGPGASGASVTIPTYMISYSDGLDISNAYGAGTGTVTMTITPWGLGYQNDLGFIPQGYAMGQNYATPASQLVSSGNPVHMQAIDGAFIGNFGTHLATNVKLGTNVTFTPTGGSPSTIHTATISLTPAFDNTNPAADSIWALFVPPYDLTGITGNGMVKIDYQIISPDSVDQFPFDNTMSTSFYTTTNIYSKGKYDFVNNYPLATLYQSSSVTNASDLNYIWGNMYYVNKPGNYAETVKWTMTSNSPLDTGHGTLISSITETDVYLFKWVDGSNGHPLDSFMENGELTLVGLAVKSFLPSAETAADTVYGHFSLPFKDSTGAGTSPALDASSWYYVAVELPTDVSTGTGLRWYLGSDATGNNFPRSYGRWQNSYLEYYSPIWEGGRKDGSNTMWGNANIALQPCPFGGNYDLDSVYFDNEKGLVPAVALLTTTTPNSVSSTAQQAIGSFELYPNPATDYVTASVALGSSAKTVTYTILSTSARTISKVTHYDVQNEKYTYNTSKLPAGNYFMVVTADGKGMFKKFTVLR